MGFRGVAHFQSGIFGVSGAADWRCLVKFLLVLIVYFCASESYE
jgi:hypothetical protein